ncbi:MAG: hypothetical protein LBL62_10200 [Planctomycetaceae bacterium]|jgi:transposase|nr:hypothetical protein [Planctomycetaceae bacterium]
MRGKRHLHGGRATVRNALYMSAMDVTRTKTDNVFKRTYQHFIEKKPPKVALIAVAHKIQKIAHSLIKNNCRWENKIFTN